jgi:hypothetical protein
VNKALDFVKKGGFTEELNDPGDDRPATLSPATLKEGWRACAASSPFGYAALSRKRLDAIPPDVGGDELLTLPEIVDLEIDQEDGVLEAGRILQNLPRLRTFFESAHYIQDVLLERLQEASKKNIPFVKFPDTIRAHVIEPREFSPAQLEIIKGYHAPGFSRFGPAIGP